MTDKQLNDLREYAFSQTREHLNHQLRHYESLQKTNNPKDLESHGYHAGAYLAYMDMLEKLKMIEGMTREKEMV